MISNLIAQFWRSFLQLNLFKKRSSTEQTLLKEQIATRLYVCSLILILITIAIITGCMIRTVEKTESEPSQTRFLQLSNIYSNTLNCPCSKYAINYQKFVTTHVQFHQVCSSQFIEQEWFDMLFTNTNISLESTTDDFRITLSFFWQTIGGLCNASQQSWEEAAASFNATRFLSPNTLNEEILRNQVKTTFQSQIELSKITMNRTLLVIRRMTSGNQMVSGLQTNFQFYTTSYHNGVRTAPRIFDNCSCINIEGCPRPATFIDNSNNTIIIPGMIRDCLLLDATFSSTLECYYNQTCISLLHSSLSIQIQPLSNISLKHFPLNSAIEKILNELMIEEMIINVQYDSYYSECNPQYCSYSYTRRFNIIFVITTIIGIFGGLSFGLRVLAPLITIIILHWENRAIPNTILPQIETSNQSRSTGWIRIRSVSKHVKEFVVSLNIFESSTVRTSNNIYHEQLYTRFFIFLTIICSIELAFYIFLTEQNQSIIVEHPSLTTYEQLYEKHFTTLQCPCSQISMPYQSFMNVSFILHQVCSSDLVSSEWLNYLILLNPIAVPAMYDFPGTRDFREMGTSYFQLLSTFCSMIEMNINDAQRVFSNTQFINDRVLSSSLFFDKTQAIIDLFIKTTRNNFARTIDWINIAFSASHFFNGANTLSQITITTDNKLYIYFDTHAQYTIFTDTFITSTSSCSCAFRYDHCFLIPILHPNQSHLDRFPVNTFFHVIEIGCVPLTGFLNSKIGWWYKDINFHYIRETYALIIDSQSPPKIQALNVSITSRFNDTITNNLVLELFSEEFLTNNTHFDQFYNQCAPISCTYSRIQRRNILVALLLFVAICGGINTILRLLIPLFGKLFFSSINWWKERHYRRDISICDYVKHCFINIYQSMKTLNLFSSEITDERSILLQQIYTRVYLILYLTSLGILLFYTAIIERSLTQTYSVSSLNDYQQLLIDLKTDQINCPCTRISIPYGDFVTELRVNTFHEACSTETVEYIIQAGTPDYSENLLSRDDRFSAWKYFFMDSFKLLCSLAQNSVENSIAVFLASTMLTNQLQKSKDFTQEINDTIDQFQQRIPMLFTQTLNLIRMTTQGNALLSMFSANWDIVIDEQDALSNNTFLTVPVVYQNIEQNTSCSCATLRTCSFPLAYPPSNESDKLFVDGLFFGSCITDFRHRLFIPNELYDYTIQLHNSSTRFNINDTIEKLASEMFIESWTSSMSYENFYDSCSPTYCTYTYYYRFDAFELLATFLSVFAGLSTAVRFIIPHLVKIFQNLQRRIRVTPIQS
ncbi:unnamed protein product [Adineta ricciae]|uniref:Uncharacterized protein n=1 Tax=Adineta ricciae TaxID=249248 RepID=A0A815K496_ADIRI|nr:unnamed protein product [Adineta ricciae]